MIHSNGSCPGDEPVLEDVVVYQRYLDPEDFLTWMTGDETVADALADAVWKFFQHEKPDEYAEADSLDAETVISFTGDSILLQIVRPEDE